MIAMSFSPNSFGVKSPARKHGLHRRYASSV
jgi:hypothetical protein